MNRREIFLLSIGIFLTAFAWLLSDLFHANTKEKTKIDTAIPIIKTYTINPELLKILEERK